MQFDCETVGDRAAGGWDSCDARRYLYQIASHDETWEEWGVQGTAVQTGAAAACAVTRFVHSQIPQRGVVAPEQLDPAAFIAEMHRVGLATGVMDLPAA